VFHNEALSVLLRTIISVLDRTDPDHLHEIVLIDDASTLGKSEKMSCSPTDPPFQIPTLTVTDNLLF